MELNIEKIHRIKKVLGLTWEDISDLGGLGSRQAAYEKCKPSNLRAAEFFGKIFNIDPLKLLK